MKALFKKLPRGSALSQKELLRRAKKIRLFAMDVDGVLTDGKIVVLDSGEEVKSWDVKDRIAFFILRKFGDRFRVAWITGRKSLQVETRAKEIGVASLFQNCDHKGRALEEAAAGLSLTMEQTVFMGDDLVDLPALRRAGLAVCPSDAHPSVRAVCHWVTKSPGGNGAVREMADFVLEAQGLMGPLLEMFENPDRRPNP
ncbi:MAG: HAD hydrolase family protein [Elusimicrobia bacterium]|nr:HAD hydrolase family protein [Elusimicrobiota bacterium]